MNNLNLIFFYIFNFCKGLTIINYIVPDSSSLVISPEYMAEFLAVPPSKIWLVPGIETITFIDEVALKCVNINICIYDETELHVPNIP